MDIVFLLTQDIESPSGLGRYFPIARELTKHGYHVRIYALHPDFFHLKEKKFVKDGVDICYVYQMHVQKANNNKKYFSNLRLIQIVCVSTIKLFLYCISTPSDIVFVGKPHPMNGVAGVLIKIFKKNKLVLDCDDYETTSNKYTGKWQKKIINYFENTIPKFADLITANTNFNINRIIDLGISEEKILYLPNGVDRNRFANLDERKLNLIRNQLAISDEKIVSFIGSISLHNHPVDLLIKSFCMVLEQYAKVKLMIVGGGGDLLFLKEYVKKLGIEKDVIFLGRVPPEETPYYYKISDITVDPIYEDETAKGRSPVKMFESWAVGTPFITVDVGDRKGQGGKDLFPLFLSSSKPEDLAEMIINLLTHHSEIDDYKQKELNIVKEYYWDVQIIKLIQAFENIFGSSNK